MGEERFSQLFLDFNPGLFGESGRKWIEQINAKNPGLRLRWNQLQPWYIFPMTVVWAVKNWQIVDRQNDSDITETLFHGNKASFFSPRVNLSMRIGFLIGKGIDWIKNPYWD